MRLFTYIQHSILERAYLTAAACPAPHRHNTNAAVHNAQRHLEHQIPALEFNNHFKPEKDIMLFLRDLVPRALWAVVCLSYLSSIALASGDSSEDASATANASSSEDTDDALGNNKSTEYFSVPAFFITFRETIEVCCLFNQVVAFISCCFHGSSRPQSKK